jgi:hypothetical protein
MRYSTFGRDNQMHSSGGSQSGYGYQQSA